MTKTDVGPSRSDTIVPPWSWRKAIVESDVLTATEKHVALTLSLHMSEIGDSCFPSYPTLARETSRSRSTVVLAVNGLRDAGFLRVESEGGGRRSNRYVATSPPSDYRTGGVRRSDGTRPTTGPEVPIEEVEEGEEELSPSSPKPKRTRTRTRVDDLRLAIFEAWEETEEEVGPGSSRFKHAQKVATDLNRITAAEIRPSRSRILAVVARMREAVIPIPEQEEIAPLSAFTYEALGKHYTHVAKELAAEGAIERGRGEAKAGRDGLAPANMPKGSS